MAAWTKLNDYRHTKEPKVKRERRTRPGCIKAHPEDNYYREILRWYYGWLRLNSNQI